MKRWTCKDLMEDEIQEALEKVESYKERNRGRTYISWTFDNKLWMRGDVWGFLFWYQKHAEKHPDAVKSFDYMFDAWCFGRYMERNLITTDGWSIA